MTRETWFKKVGRKYVAIGEAEHYDYQVMPPQGFTLTYRKDGVTRWEYAVKADNASFVSAAMVAREAMEAAAIKAAAYRPTGTRKYTTRQLAIIKQFNVDMGMHVPLWWQEASAREIVQAGIDAVTAA